MKKKITAFFMALVILTTFVPFNVFADEPELSLPSDSDILKGLEESWGAISDSTANLSADLGGADVSGFLSGVFKSCISTLASNPFQVITAINGSVTFLRLIGVIEDPTAKALANIQDSLNTLNTKIDEIDGKLDKLTDNMTKMQATVEFNDRALRSRELFRSWDDFDQYYMENGLDKTIEEFQSYTRIFINDWFNQTNEERKNETIDTSIILVKYVNNTPTNILDNSIPETCEDNEKYVLIPSQCVPEDLKNKFDADKYNETERNAILALLKSNTDLLECKNCKIGDFDLEELAADAVEALNYRIVANGVRGNDYRTKVSDILYSFKTYCNNLTASGKGIDAKINSLYLSHAFESEISDELTKFIDQMMFKTGTYELFIQDLMGMSNLVTDSDKRTIINLFNETIKKLEEAKKNCVTGNKNFCYLTNSLVNLSVITYSNDLSVKVDDNGYYHDYKGASSSSISRSIADSGTMLGDVDVQILYYTLNANGNGSDMTGYLTKNLFNVYDYNYIVTGENGEKELPKNSSEQLYYYRAAGKYMGDSDDAKVHCTGTVSLKNLDSDLDSEYIINNRMYTGTVFDSDSRTIRSNFTLHASAIYGETHSYWFADEVYMFGGPNRSENFYPTNSDNYPDRFYNPYVTYKQTNRNHYNVLLSNPYVNLGNTGDDQYSPLDSLMDINKDLSSTNTESSDTNTDTDTINISLGNNDSPALLEGNPDTGAPVISIIPLAMFSTLLVLRRKKL